MTDRGAESGSFGNDRINDREQQQQVLELFRSRLEAGENVDVEEFVLLHPELEDELRMIFDWLDLRPVVDEDLSSSSDDAGAPRVLGDFRIIRKIGSGGMATVYLAEQISIKRKVAVKVLSTHLSFSRRAIEKFLSEAEAQGRQVHSGIVSVYAVGEQDGIYYIAQELVPQGVSLADRLDTLRREGGLPIGYFRDAAELFARTADALQFAHNSKVIHRDVKPKNILLTEEGLPKVCDFGLATTEGGLVPSGSRALAGSPDYMSPEQLSRRGEIVDQRSDIFSLGVAFYETLTLERPFAANSPRQVMQKVLFHDPGETRKVNPRVPRDLSVICQKTLEKDPGRRYQTMAELSADLRRFLSGEPIMAEPAGVMLRITSWVRRHKPASIAVCALLAALLIVAYQGAIISRQKELKQRFIQRQYKDVREVRGWPDASTWNAAWRWYLMADPGDPGGILLAAVFYIEQNQPGSAMQRLADCIEACSERGEESLEGEARFLLGVLKLSRADSMTGSPEERAMLASEARSAIRQAGDFKPASGEALVWRDLDPSSVTPAQARRFLRELKLNSQHHLIRLDQGVIRFTRLYKGGRRQEFEETIDLLEKVLISRPANIAALVYLGRVYFFYARTYGYFELLDRAQELCERAARESSGRPYHMIETTLGQIRLMYGDLAEAFDYFESAVEAASYDVNRLAGIQSAVHNALCGKGNVLARQGRYDAAMGEYEKALGHAPNDVHVRVNMARVESSRGRPDEALAHALEAMTFTGLLPDRTEIKISTHFAPAYLNCARAHLEKGEVSKTERYLWEMVTDSIDCPRSLSLACFLVATFPDEVFRSKKGRETMTLIAGRLARKAGSAAPDSALTLSARGVSNFFEQEYAEAIACFEKASAARDRWPEQVRRHLWHYDCADDYFLALVYSELARDRGRDLTAANKARQFFKKAETAFVASELPFGETDIIRRIRLKARKTLHPSD